MFWKLLKDQDEDTKEITTIPILKYYSVFHLDQCENILPRWKQPLSSDPVTALVLDDKAEKVILDYVDRSGVTYNPCKSDRACYTPATDTITVPELSQYSDIAEFYSSAFHEIIHSTGAVHRLNRLSEDYSHEAYSREELIAEIGSSFLCSHCGVESDSSFRNSVAYLQGWSKALRNDKRLIVSAAGKAEKAANYVLGKEDTHDDEEF